MIKTVTLEQAKKIKELGIEINTTWEWANWHGEWIIFRFGTMSKFAESYKAPQAEEMLDRMPKQLDTASEEHPLRIDFHESNYLTGELCDIAYRGIICFSSESLSVVVGDMFIWCAEKGHLEANAPT